MTFSSDLKRVQIENVRHTTSVPDYGRPGSMSSGTQSVTPKWLTRRSRGRSSTGPVETKSYRIENLAIKREF